MGSGGALEAGCAISGSGDGMTSSMAREPHLLARFGTALWRYLATASIYEFGYAGVCDLDDSVMSLAPQRTKVECRRGVREIERYLLAILRDG